jgi:uncharacterized protein (DUF433 family)/DNA-binding transcriptional MerR regulator
MPTWQGFYSTPQVARLAQIPLSTLYDWKSRGIIDPSVHVMDGENEVLDGYSYADLTIIKILRALREDQLDLRSAGTALRHLWNRLGPPSNGWSEAQVYIVGKRVYAVKQDEWEATDATQFGQKIEVRVLGDLSDIFREQEEEGSLLIPKDYQEYVELDPEIMGGQPVVRGTRVPTSILAMLGQQGRSVTELARLYFPIPRGTIAKVIEYEAFLDRTGSTARATTARH